MATAEITLYRQVTTNWPGGPTVHVMDRRHGFMLVAPSPCQNVLAEILAETATVSRDRFTRLDRAALVHRGYCRHCLDSVG